jgi:hypothetical protein
MKRLIIVIFSIISGYVLATLLAVALSMVGIDIPAMFAKSSSEYTMYGGVQTLLMNIGLSWAIYQVLARHVLEKKAPEPTLTVSPSVATAVERLPQVPLADTPSPAQPAFLESAPSPVATAVESDTPASGNASQPAVRVKEQWTRPTPLLLAVGLALAWGVLSVGPSQLVSALGEVIPRDTVTAPSCPSGSYIQDSRCSRDRFRTEDLATLTDPGCYGQPDTTLGVPGPHPLPGEGPVLETDGMCHARSGGDVSWLVNDVFLGGQNALLAFLAIGAALLIWPRLQAASPPPG